MKLLTTKQVARLYGVSREHVKFWRVHGKIGHDGKRVHLVPAYHPSQEGKDPRRGIRFDVESVKRFFASTETPGDYLTTSEAAKMAGVSRDAVWVWIRRGFLVNGQRHRLPATKAKEKAILRTDLQAFLKLREQEMDRRLDAVIQRRTATMPEGEGRVRNERRKPAGKGMGE